MDAGSLAQLPPNSFGGSAGLPLPGGGIASRRGGQGIKPLSFDTLQPGVDKDPGVPTPRTSRSHLLAGLRTAPKSATAATFPTSPTTAAPPGQSVSRNGLSTSSFVQSQPSAFNGPKTSLPRFPQAQTYRNGSSNNNYGQQQYTPDQILAPPAIQLDDHDASEYGNEYAELVATNMYLAAQKHRLQQQLMSVQAAQQQFQSLTINNGNTAQAWNQSAYQQLLLQQQQQEQQQLAMTSGVAGTANVYAYVDPLTGQQTLYVGQGTAQLSNQFVDQYNANVQQLQHLQLLQQQLQLQQQQQQQQQQQEKQEQLHQDMLEHHQKQLQQQQQQQQQRRGTPGGAPRLQVCPPSELSANGLQASSPPRRFNSPSDQTVPLPPPSAGAFRRGHKKSNSMIGALATNGSDMPKSAGPKSAGFLPNGPPTGTYGPGQGRAGEHPVRQPRGPPNFDELARKPTSKHEGSLNFATRTRRSAVHNLKRAGISRRQGHSGSGSPGSISPVSETAEDLPASLADDDSMSSRSGSGSLNGDEVECSLPSSRTSTGSWGAIGSERPGSREKATPRGDSPTPAEEKSTNPGSFAAVFKSAVSATAAGEAPRRGPMLVLTNAEKRKMGTA